MRWNEPEVAQLAKLQADWEGILIYKPPPEKNSLKFFASNSQNERRERWFRLKHNCLFYFRLQDGRRRPPLGSEPMGVLILGNWTICPYIICPQKVCPETVCQETVCPETVCPW